VSKVTYHCYVIVVAQHPAHSPDPGVWNPQAGILLAKAHQPPVLRLIGIMSDVESISGFDASITGNFSLVSLIHKQAKQISATWSQSEMSFGIDRSITMVKYDWGDTEILIMLKWLRRRSQLCLPYRCSCLNTALGRKSKNKPANSWVFVGEGGGGETSLGRRVFVVFDGLVSVRNNSALRIGSGSWKFSMIDRVAVGLFHSQGCCG
jgi:hypothetical protein